MKNLSHHTALCELATSLLIRRIQMEEMSQLGWLIGLVEHATWADSLYFLYLLLLSISKILALSEPTP
jgi:ABC-type Fe3+-siderophore transport system permease subunit